MKLALTIYDALVEWKHKDTPTPQADALWHKYNGWVVDIVRIVNKLQQEK